MVRPYDWGGGGGGGGFTPHIFFLVVFLSFGGLNKLCKREVFFSGLKENQLVSLSFDSASLRVYFLFAPGSFSLLSPVHFLPGLQFTFSLVSNSVSLWVHFLLGSTQFLFGLRFSFSS